MPASMIKESDPLYCLELPKLNDCSNESGPYLLLCWVNVLVVEDQCSRYLFLLPIYVYYLTKSFNFFVYIIDLEVPLQCKYAVKHLIKIFKNLY